MNLGAIVEVAIGLIFVWIVLSLTIIQSRNGSMSD